MRHIDTLRRRLSLNGKSIGLLILLSVLLGACQTDGIGTTTKVSTICQALVGPIKYNSKNEKSLRYAARALVPDLAERNRIGQALNCPAYR